MVVDFDSKLTELAADILRDAAQVYDRSDIEVLPSGMNPVTTALNAGGYGSLEGTGSFQAITGAFQAITGSFNAIGHEADLTARLTLKRLFRIPSRLPAVRLPLPDELAAAARSAPLMVALESLASWLGRDGRPVTADERLSAADEADAVRCTGIPLDYLPLLWRHALVSGWFELVGGSRQRRNRAVIGQAAYHWADGDATSALHVWAVLFASVLATTLSVVAGQAPDAARKLNFQGQGVALAVMLFLARRTGLSTDEVRELVRDGAIGQRPADRARRAWDAWVRDQGDPALRLLGELAALGAVSVPRDGRGDVALTPLALWALRKQFGLDNISVPLIRTPTELLSASDLVALCEGASEADLTAEFTVWLGRRGADRAARELLDIAAFGDARSRLTAVNLVRRIGPQAYQAWRDAMSLPELRGYARIALLAMAGDLPAGALPRDLEPSPEDLTWMATDLLALACGDEEPDEEQLAEQFTQAVPPGEESRIFSLMSRSPHPDVERVLEVLGEYHPDRRVARSARKAARVAAKKRPVPRPKRAPAHSRGR